MGKIKKVVSGWTDTLPSGTVRARYRHPVTKLQMTHEFFPKDYRVQTPDGKWHDAQWAAETSLNKFLSEDYLTKTGIAGTSQPLPELIEKYFEDKRNLKWKTLSHYHDSMNHFSREFPTWENFTEDGLRSWKQKLIAQRLANNTVNGIINDVGMFCTWLVENKKMEISPFPKKNYRPGITPSQPRFYTIEEWLALEHFLIERNHHARVGCRLAHDFGLREVEIVGDGVERLEGVQWSDLIWRPDGMVDLLIRANVTKGSKKARKVHLDAPFMALLGSRKSGPLVPITRNHFVYQFERARTLAGLDGKEPPLTIHGLRHTFGMNYMQSTGTLHELAELLGHENEETTQIYAQFQQSHLDDRMEKLSEKRARDQAVAMRVVEQPWIKKAEIVELNDAVMHRDEPDKNNKTSRKSEQKKFSDGR